MNKVVSLLAIITSTSSFIIAVAVMRYFLKYYLQVFTPDKFCVFSYLHRREVRESELGDVPWRDVTAEEEDAWKEMLSRQGKWIKIVLPLRAISPH